MAMNREPNKKDFWSWAEGGVGAPTGADVKSSAGEPTPAPLGPSAMDQQLNSMMLGKGIEATAAGLDAGIKTAMATPLAPVAVQGASVAPGVTAIGSNPLVTEALISSGIPGLAPVAASTIPGAAPVVASTVPGAVTGSLGTALGTAGIAGGTTAAGTLAGGTAGAGALGAGGSAAMAAMGPVGWTIGGLMLAKQFGLF